MNSPSRQTTRSLGLRLALGLAALALAETRAADSAPSPRFTEHLVMDGFSYGFGLSAADLDGDGFPDLVAANTSGFVQTEPYTGESWPAPVRRAMLPQPHIRNSHVYWFKNDGKGNFTRHYITKNDPARRLERQVIADMNNDGRPDVVIVDNLLGDVLWYENPGPAALARGELWKKHYVARDTMLGAEDVTVADFDGDGYLDVAAAGWRMGNCFKWFKNPGPGHNPSEGWDGWVIDGGYPVARCVWAGDIDGDGKPDLLTTSDTSRIIIWYQNPGDPAHRPWRRNVIDATHKEPIYARLVDMNHDGRLDVLVALGGYGTQQKQGGAEWYENTGKTEGRVQWKKHSIFFGSFSAVDLAPADFNGDGVLDIVALGGSPGQVAWFESPRDPAGRWTKHDLKNDWRNANRIVVADFNHDGRPDFAGIADYGSMELIWWRNEGRP